MKLADAHVECEQYHVGLSWDDGFRCLQPNLFPEFENERGCSHSWHWAKAYQAQVNWARSIRKSLSHEPTWRRVPKPPDYSKHTDWVIGGNVEGRQNTWQANIWKLLHKEETV